MLLDRTVTIDVLLDRTVTTDLLAYITVVVCCSLPETHARWVAGCFCFVDEVAAEEGGRNKQAQLDKDVTAVPSLLCPLVMMVCSTSLSVSSFSSSNVTKATCGCAKVLHRDPWRL